MGIEQIRKLKEEALLPKEKKIYHLNKVSPKKKARDAADKIVLDEAAEKEKWFNVIRIKLTGTCQCGCGNKSSKHEDDHFRASCCHIFPKNDFKSIMFHPLNYVERNFWDGCHSNFDNQSMDRWVNMADWEDIKAKFLILEPLLTEEEKTKKFYHQLKGLVENN